MIDDYKFQLSFCKKMMLIYNKDRSVNVEFAATGELKELMGDNLKCYFKADIVIDGDEIESLIVIDECDPNNVEW